MLINDKEGKSNYTVERSGRHQIDQGTKINITSNDTDLDWTPSDRCNEKNPPSLLSYSCQKHRM